MPHILTRIVALLTYRLHQGYNSLLGISGAGLVSPYQFNIFELACLHV